MRRNAFVLVSSLLCMCAQRPAEPPAQAAAPHSHAIYGEYARDANKKAQPGLNRRLFNKVEAQSGPDIRLNDDGCIALAPGTYRMTGFSMVSMQVGFAPPTIDHANNYPGYCLVYRQEDETKGQAMLAEAIGIGSPSTAADMAGSLFDAIHSFDRPANVCVGHQAGENLNDEVYLWVYEVDGVKSDYHVSARIAITKLR